MPTTESVMIRSEAATLKPAVLAEHSGRCFVCGFDFLLVLVMHHITPVSEGGDNERSNLVIVCPTCHAIVHRPRRTHHQMNDGGGLISCELTAREFMDWGFTADGGRWSPGHEERLWMVVDRGIGRCN